MKSILSTPFCQNESQKVFWDVLNCISDSEYTVQDYEILISYIIQTFSVEESKIFDDAITYLLQIRMKINLIIKKKN